MRVALVFLLASLLVAGAVEAPPGRALLVGITDYQHHPPLKGPWNDVLLMERVLSFPATRKLGGPGVSVSRQQVVQAFRSHLIQGSHPSTVAVFYYAGHGTRIPDPTAMSGYSSALVMSDSPRRRSEAASTLLTGSELNQLARELAAITPHVTVIVDSCHSGAVGRALDGRVRQVALEGEAPAERSVRTAVSGWAPPGTPLSYTLLAACRSTQLAIEKPQGANVHGCFTYALASELSRGTRKPSELIDRVRLAMPPEQDPQWEGSAALLGEATPEPEPYFRILKREGNRLLLDGGAVHGLTDGATLALHTGGSRVGSATIVSLEGMQSWATLTEGTAPTAACAVLATQSWGSNVLRVAGPPELGSLPELRLVTEEPIDARVVALSAGRYALGDLTLDLNGARSRLRALARRKLILALDNPAARRDIALSLHRITGEDLPRSPGGELQLAPGEQFALRIRNGSPNTAWYVSILDLTPEGTIDVAFPAAGSGEAVEDNYLPAGESYSLAFQTGEHPGREVFVAIATRKPVDLAAVAARSVTPADPLQRLLHNALTGARGDVSTDCGDWHTSRLVVTVVSGS